MHVKSCNKMVSQTRMITETELIIRRIDQNKDYK